jgi:antitoxin component of RelBE/YafQ-DinJ toxin-antitoxin module
MSNKKLNIMSLSIEPEMQDRLKKVAKAKGVSVSKMIRDLVDKYLVVDDDSIPVILKIPSHMKGEPESLQNWLDAKTAAIVKALSV